MTTSVSWPSEMVNSWEHFVLLPTVGFAQPCLPPTRDRSRPKGVSVSYPVRRFLNFSDLRLLHKVQHRAFRLLALACVSDIVLRHLRLQFFQQRWVNLGAFRATKSVARQPIIDLFSETGVRASRTRAADTEHAFTLLAPRFRTSHHQRSFLLRTMEQHSPGGVRQQ